MSSVGSGEFSEVRINGISVDAGATASQPLAANIFAFRYLLMYFVLVAIIGIGVVAMQRYQTSLIGRVNGELSRTN